MNSRLSFVELLGVAAILLSLVTGCGQQNHAGGDQGAGLTARGGDHGDYVDPHDVPLTEDQKQLLRQETAKFADAIARVKEFRDAIQEETKSGLPENPFEAHQALDQADLVVQWLPKIAQDSGIPKEHWETVTTAANELREAFDKVHQNIDSKVDPDFASVQQLMIAKIDALEAITK